MNRFEIFDLRSQSNQFNERLEEIIKPSSLSLRESYSLASTLFLLRNRLGAATALVERDYIDADFQSQYSFWYSKSFKKISNLCHRIHFFRRTLTLQEIANEKVEKGDYLGYTILTPLTTGRVGRTVICPWTDQIDVAGDVCTPSILCAQSPVHLFGSGLSVEGFPYTSQDAMVMVCAQSAIWMAIQYLHNRYSSYGVKRHYPDDITAAATRYLLWGGRILPSGGLTQFHMVNALSNLDCQPIIDSPTTNSQDWDVANWMVKYLDSEIPILMTLDHPPHAIVIVGALHGMSPSTLPSAANVVGFHHWAKGFIVNDDNLGPYKIMPLTDASFPTLKQSYDDLLPHSTTWKSIAQADGIIVPLPKEISIQARHIDLLVQEILSPDPSNFILSELMPDPGKACKDLKYFIGTLMGDVAGNRIVTRAYLIRSMEFLTKIKSRYPKQLCEFYSEQQYPLYIWVVELMTQDEVINKQPGSRALYGEIIFDSTANRYDPCWLSVHVADRVVLRNHNTEDVSVVDCKGVTTYLSHKLT